MATRIKSWVYLMKDLRSGFIKIGWSTKPVYREKTLQAEQPLIELMEAWAGNQADERVLHKCFKSVRLRGEWFKLGDMDIARIRDAFRDRVKYSSGKSELEEREEEARRRYHEEHEYIYPPDALNAAAYDFLAEGFGIDI